MISEWVTRAIIGGGLDRKTKHDCDDCYECCDAHIQHALVISNPRTVRSAGWFREPDGERYATSVKNACRIRAAIGSFCASLIQNNRETSGSLNDYSPAQHGLRTATIAPDFS